MYFDSPSQGECAAPRSEAQIHALYQKILVLVRTMQSFDDIAWPLTLTLQGLYGCEGAAIACIDGGGIRFLSALGLLSHIKDAHLNMTPALSELLVGEKAIIAQRDTLLPDYVDLTLNAKFNAMAAVPLALNGYPYGFLIFVSSKPNYFQTHDADTMLQVAQFLSMVIETHRTGYTHSEIQHYERMGVVDTRIVGHLQQATVDLLQVFAQLRNHYVEQKYQAMAAPMTQALSHIEMMAQSIQDLRALSDICRRPDMAPSSVSIRHLFENVCNYNSSRLEPIARVCIHVEDALPNVHADYTLLWQAIHELLLNAIRAIEATPETTDHAITLRAFAHPNLVILDILDTGCGIAPNVFPHVMEPFFSTWPPKKGLGLTRTAMIIMRLGGELRLCPNKPNGTLVRITFRDEEHTAQEEIF